MEALLDHGIVEVAALADPVVERAQDAAALCPGAAVGSSLEDLLTSQLDGVVIATPSALHAQQSLECLARGLAVFCQKPLGRDAEETALVVETARDKDRLLGVDLSYRSVAGVDALRQLARSGALGHVFAVDAVFHNAYGPDKAWFYDARQSGGGCMMDLGIHLIDLAQWLLDFPAVREVRGRLFARGQRLHGRRDIVEDFGVAELDYEGGGIARIACSWNLDAGADAVIAVELHGSEGGAALRNLNGSFYDFAVERFHGTSRERIAGPPDAWGGRALVAWAEQLARSRSFDPEAERLVEVAALIDAVYLADGAESVYRRAAGSRK